MNRLIKRSSDGAVYCISLIEADESISLRANKGVIEGEDPPSALAVPMSFELFEFRSQQTI